jgi:hypothetical protein
MTIYDYLYVDLDKVISLYSQLTGGVVELRESSREGTQSADNKRHYDFKIFKHDAGGTSQDKTGFKEVIKPHHSLLMELEQELIQKGYLIDLSSSSQSLCDSSFRKQLKNTLCVKVKGRAVIEDYERIKGIASVFPQVVGMINKSCESTLKSSPEFLEMQDQIKELELQIKQTNDRNERAKKEQKLKHIKVTLDETVSTAAKVQVIDQWVLDGVRTWIDAFLPGIVNLRVYPSMDRPDEHIFGHLKKKCFEDADSHSFHFTYGSLPTEELTMIGIITSVPNQGADEFKPLAEFEKESLAEHESVEQAFRGMFRGFDGMEQLIRTSRFPRVLVHPLTVFRSVESNQSLRHSG